MQQLASVYPPLGVMWMCVWAWGFCSGLDGPCSDKRALLKRSLDQTLLVKRLNLIYCPQHYTMLHKLVTLGRWYKCSVTQLYTTLSDYNEYYEYTLSDLSPLITINTRNTLVHRTRQVWPQSVILVRCRNLHCNDTATNIIHFKYFTKCFILIFIFLAWWLYKDHAIVCPL
jgi:hypothetical protein